MSTCCELALTVVTVQLTGLPRIVEDPLATRFQPTPTRLSATCCTSAEYWRSCRAFPICARPREAAPARLMIATPSSVIAIMTSTSEKPRLLLDETRDFISAPCPG